ncbi:NTP pyrophosphohydrolase [Streptomyces sp. WAC04114]|uniref:NTP pyrophosphohydrolase n=1 Tax=Streptomyces sp. WAC04114 TaxID=2867961 RepID=UPI001C8B45F3|nr:NTP pyrophosphohydrolase [Streptomyces sp. WAC04114]
MVDRDEAIRQGRPHRVATMVCRDPRGRVLGYRRPEHVSRFPGHHVWLIGGAVEVGESFDKEAISDGSGVRGSVTTASCTPSQCGLIAPRQRNVKTNRTRAWTPCSSTGSRHGRLGEAGCREVIREPLFVPDGLDVLRQPGLGPQSGVTP